jgi:hypothetical protein
MDEFMVKVEERITRCGSMLFFYIPTSFKSIMSLSAEPSLATSRSSEQAGERERITHRQKDRTSRIKNFRICTEPELQAT